MLDSDNAVEKNKAEKGTWGLYIERREEAILNGVITEKTFA